MCSFLIQCFFEESKELQTVYKSKSCPEICYQNHVDLDWPSSAFNFDALP